MIQIVKQTDKEKMAMYMKCKKKELSKMLIQCNKHLEYNLHDNECILMSFDCNCSKSND